MRTKYYNGGGRKRQMLGPVSIGICVAILLVVYFTAYHVGEITSDPRQRKLLNQSKHTVEMRKSMLQKCKDTIVAIESGDVTEEAALTTYKSRYYNNMEALKTERTLVAEVRRSTAACNDEVAKRQKELTGAVGDAAAFIQHLEEEQEKLEAELQQIKAVETDTDTGLLRRRELKEVQKALAQQIIKMRKDNKRPEAGEEPDKAVACADSNERYSVVFDIGSTGNRVHVFRFALRPEQQRQEGEAAEGLLNRLELKHELFEQNHDALSKFDDAVLAAKALEPLFFSARDYVPVKLQPCTPLEFKATAGLRRAGKAKANRILDTIRSYYAAGNFWLKGAHPARILEGYEEGPLAWLTVNYLLGNFRNAEVKSGGTAAIIDLGGGSTQIVFEPTGRVLAALNDDFVFSAQLGARHVKAYQHSYDGLGLHAAVKELIFHVQGKCAEGEATPPNDDDDDDDGPGAVKLEPNEDAMEHFPCFPVGYSDDLGVRNSPRAGDNDDGNQDGEGRNGSNGAANFEQCEDLFRRYVVRDDTPCALGTCGMQGVFQPSLQNFTGPVYAFSYIYDLMYDARKDTSTEEVTLEEMETIGRERCAALTMAALDDPNHPTVSPAMKPAYECLYYSYVCAMLRYGYKVGPTTKMHIAKKIDGYETAWALGAAIQTLTASGVSKDDDNS